MCILSRTCAMAQQVQCENSHPRLNYSWGWSNSPHSLADYVDGSTHKSHIRILPDGLQLASTHKFTVALGGMGNSEVVLSASVRVYPRPDLTSELLQSSVSMKVRAGS